MQSGITTSKEAERFTVDICLIDLRAPTRRRVVVAVSEPPEQIQTDADYFDSASYTIDGELSPEPGPHAVHVLVEAVLALYTEGGVSRQTR